MINEFFILQPEIKNADKILESIKLKDHDLKKSNPENDLKIIDIKFVDNRAVILIRSSTFSKVIL